VKRAYLKLAKRLHPDHLVRLGLTELKEKANDVFAQVSRAHEVLSDPEERARYQESLTGVSETEALLAAQAEQYYQRGEMLIRAGNFRGALQLLERAVQTYEREADYHGLLAWALHRTTPPDNARALQHFERALELGGEEPQRLLRMSLVLRELGEGARAGQLAQRARSLDAGVKA
jgi:curved DNA-binding protein CbpA